MASAMAILSANSIMFVYLTMFGSSPVSCYTIQRIDENAPPINVEIDFYSNTDLKKFLSALPANQNRPLEIDSSTDRTSKYTMSPPRDASEEANPRMYVVVMNRNTSYEVVDTSPMDSWSVVWYVASFGGLVIFFLIVSCSEWCCKRSVQGNEILGRTSLGAVSLDTDTPPPSYDHFAPPSYESICLGTKNGEKSEYDIYVVPVHALGTLMEQNHLEDAPPSYQSASG